MVMAGEHESASPELPRSDAPDTHSRWSKEKIDKVRSMLVTPEGRLSSAFDFVFEERVRNLAMAHGVHDPDETTWWYSDHLDWLRSQKLWGYVDLRGIRFQDCRLENADLRYTHLGGADLSGCDLRNADLTGAILRGANLTGANLRGAKLNHTILIEADSSKTTLSGASLRQALLYDCKLVNADLAGADLAQAQFADFHLSIAETIILRASGLYDINQVSLRNPADLSQANLYRANLSGVILGNASIAGASFYRAKFADTLIDVTQLDKTFHSRFIEPAEPASRISVNKYEREFVEVFHRESKRFFNVNGMAEMAAEYHYWEQEARTYGYSTPLHRRILRTIFLKWPYGYGSRPMWLLYYSISVVLMFAALYALFTISPIKSAIYKVHCENDKDKMILLSWRKGVLLADCLYFSLLSLATFGYGVFQPRQWLEFFRFEPVELRPLGWARILVGLEAGVGIYLLALLTTVIFGKG